jgi:hypothetical protein
VSEQPPGPDDDGDDDSPFAALEPEDLPGQPLTAAKASALLFKEIG